MEKKIYKTPTSRIVVLGPDEVMATQGGVTTSLTDSDGSWDNFTNGDINFCDDDSYIFIRGTETNTTFQDTWK